MIARTIGEIRSGKKGKYLSAEAEKARQKANGDGLTAGDIVREGPILNTYPGMGHMAGTGPAGKPCLECSRYGLDGTAIDYLVSGQLRDLQCGRFVSVMTTQDKDAPVLRIPHHAAACMFFEQVKKPVPLQFTPCAPL